MQGVIGFESQKGWWLVEESESSSLYFVHHSNVIHDRNLHLGDVITFGLAPNPLKPKYMLATDVTFIGRMKHGVFFPAVVKPAVVKL